VNYFLAPARLAFIAALGQNPEPSQLLPRKDFFMQKTYCLLSFFLTFFFVFASLSAQAQYDPQAIANEPALVESDIELYKKVLAVSIESRNDPASLNDKLNKLAEDNGTTLNHVMYINIKIPTAFSIVSNPAQKNAVLDSLQGNLKPTDEELALVEKYKDDILAAMSQVAK
jgi:hypothetical protein